MAAVKRIVLFKFKNGTTDETIGQILNGLADLKDKISGVNDFCSGSYSSPDGLNQEYTHALIMTFADEASRDAFGPHEAHQKLVEELVVPNLEGILAFDFLE